MGAREFFITIALALSGVVAGGGYAVISLTPADFALARILFSLAGAITLSVVIFWGFTSSARALARALNGALLIAVVVIATIAVLQWVDRRETLVVDNIGALAQISALRPEKTPRGEYAFPIIVKSVGISPLVNYSIRFNLIFTPKHPSLDEENSIYNAGITAFRTNSQESMLRGEMFRALRPNSSYVALQSDKNLIIDEAKMKDILSGVINVYYLVQVFYQDAPGGDIYFGRYCAIYEPRFNAFSKCKTQNFSKRIFYNK